MALCFCFDDEPYWGDVSLRGIRGPVPSPGMRSGPPPRPLYFWGGRGLKGRMARVLARTRRRRPGVVHAGYAEARALIGKGAVADLQALCDEALATVTRIFADAAASSDDDSRKDESGLGLGLAHLCLSAELEAWKRDQHAAGRILPPKGAGLTQASARVLHILDAADWPPALTTNNALFGCGIASLLMGAADAHTLFSNYVTDMAFYYEHGYDHVFPALDGLVQRGLRDPHALRTLGGRERRASVAVGTRYIQGKIALEKQHKAHVSMRAARLPRRAAQVVALSESSLLGMAAEAVARGYDAAAVMSDLVFSSPGTDVVDVGCDLPNSEVMNSLLNCGDISRHGVVGEAALRRVYDAYAATGARMLTARWHEPVARMCGALYTWHLQNDRHMFLRRALLGWDKARRTPAVPQREADWDEVFDEAYCTTGFSRPLEARYSCNGADTCNHVGDFLQDKAPLVRELWARLVLQPLAYVRAGRVDERREYEIVEGSRVCMARLFSEGLVLDMVWIICHANHHAWQVNYLFEAAMFGSLLDGGTLAGKLDREDDEG